MRQPPIFSLRPSSSMNGLFRPSVCLSVRLSHLFHYVPIILLSWNFQELLPMTDVMSMQKVKVRCQRSKVMVTEVMTPLVRFRAVTPVWIHIWDEMMHKAWCCLEEVPYCFKVIRHISSSQGTINCLFWPEMRLSGQWLKFEFTMALKWCTKLNRRGALLFFKVICQISRSHGTKKSSILTQIEGFRTVTQVWLHQWIWNDAQSLM